MEPGPKWRRRKTARPGEIEAAALSVFAERGFAAAKLEDIAARAGLSKAALYRYFPTKLDLFKAVIGLRAAPNLDEVAIVLQSAELGFADVARIVLARMAAVVDQPELRGLARMVIAEGRNFPEIVALWHEQLVSRAVGMLSALIAEGQRRGEVRDGEPRAMAFSVIGPMLLTAIWKEVMEPIGGDPIDPAAVAAEHFLTLTRGMIATPPEETP